MSESQDEYSSAETKKTKFNNTIPLWGNESTMNLNALILTNIQSSTYFKVTLFKLKTYHEVIDEIYYQVKHMEPWEKGSRKTSGQTGMCGGVRGVGAGGIVSSAYCLLYKLYTLRLTRKQLMGLLTHTDSPYIRALGFMYLRYTQPPGDLYDWYEQYLQDEEEIDVKAGGGHTMTIGQMLVQWLTKLDWFSTLFPRIPVPIQKQIQFKLDEYAREYGTTLEEMTGAEVGASNNKHNQRARQQDNFGASGQDGGGRNNHQYDNRQQRGDSHNGGGSRGRGFGGGESRNNYNRYGGDDRQSFRQKSRSRSRSPTRSRHYDSESKSSSSRGHKRRSPEYEDRYEKKGGRDRDDYYYQRDNYKSSSSSHRRNF